MKKSSGEKNNRVSIITTIILLVLIAVVFIFSTVFGSEGSTPSIFGYNIHVMNGKAMENYIPDSSAVISKVGVIPKVKEVGLCRLDDQKTVTVLLLAGIEDTEDGKVYLFKTTTSEDYEVVKLKENNIVGTANWVSVPLGRVISFATSKMGIVLLLIIPATIILISLLISIAKGLSYNNNANTDDSDEDYDDEVIEEDEDVKNAVLSFKGVDAMPEISKEVEFVDTSTEEPKNDENVLDFMIEKPIENTHESDEILETSIEKDDDEEILKDYSFTEQILLEYSPDGKPAPRKKINSYTHELLNKKEEEIKETEQLQKEPVLSTAHHVSLDSDGKAEYNKVTPTAKVSDLERTLPEKPYVSSDKALSGIDELLNSVGHQQHQPIKKPEGKIEDYNITPKKKQSSTNKALEEMMRMLEKGKR